MGFRYQLFGLCVEVNERIFGLCPQTECAAVDVRVRIVSASWFNHHVEFRSRDIWFASDVDDTEGSLLEILKSSQDGSYLLRYADGTKVLIERSGNSVIVGMTGALSPEELACYLIGPIASFLFLLRGICCLHGSAIEIDGRAAVFVGPPNSGKSTLAAALAMRGHRFIADDLVPLLESSTSWRIPAGPPRLYLRADSAADMFQHPEPNRAKESSTLEGWNSVDMRNLNRCLLNGQVPLAAIFVHVDAAGASSGSDAMELSSANAFLAILRNTWAGDILTGPMQGDEFQVLGRLVSRVPIHQLPRDPSTTRLCRHVEGILKAKSGIGTVTQHV